MMEYCEADKVLQVVDWHQGKVAVGEDQSEILKLLKSVPKPT
jgi:hypothetical protein